MAYSDEVLADTPVAYWRLGSGSTDVDDSSGNARSLTKTGSPSEVASLLLSTSDTARSFPGNNSAYYEAADEAAYDFLNTSAFSIEGWVNASSADTSFRRFFGHEDASNGWHLGVHSTEGVFFNRRAGGSGNTLNYNPGTIVGVTFHCVGTYDGTNLRFYVNGVLREGPTADSVNMGAVSNTVRTGVYTGSSQVAGTYDELAIYSTALSQARIQAHYDAGVAVVGGTPVILAPATSGMRW